MISTYQEFAKELYRTKLTVAGTKPNAENYALLKVYAKDIGELRPKLRSELYALRDEFFNDEKGITEEDKREIEAINEYYIDKLRSYHKKLLKQVAI